MKSAHMAELRSIEDQGNAGTLFGPSFPFEMKEISDKVIHLESLGELAPNTCQRMHQRIVIRVVP